MTTYKKTLVIDDPNNLVLSDLPFRSGQQVKIIILPQNYEPSPNGDKLRSLLKKPNLCPPPKQLLRKKLPQNQSLPSSQAITEEEIAAEPIFALLPSNY